MKGKNLKSKQMKPKFSAHEEIGALLGKIIASERGQLPSPERIARTGEVVDVSDPRAPAPIRVIGKVVALFGDDGVKRQLVRWPDGIVATVQGDLSTNSMRQKLLPRAYWVAFGDLVEMSMRFADRP